MSTVPINQAADVQLAGDVQLAAAGRALGLAMLDAAADRQHLAAVVERGFADLANRLDKIIELLGHGAAAPREIPDAGERLVSIKQFAALLTCSTRTIRRKLAAVELPEPLPTKRVATKDGFRAVELRWLGSTIDEWLASRGNR